MRYLSGLPTAIFVQALTSAWFVVIDRQPSWGDVFGILAMWALSVVASLVYGVVAAWRSLTQDPTSR